MGNNGKGEKNILIWNTNITSSQKSSDSLMYIEYRWSFKRIRKIFWREDKFLGKTHQQNVIWNLSHNKLYQVFLDTDSRLSKCLIIDIIYTWKDL